MKKVLSLLLSAVMLLSLVPLTVFSVSAETDSQGVEYTLSADGTYYTVSDCDESVTAVVIPAEYNGKPVKEIGDWAFSYRRSLTSIEIPDSVTSIGDWAFFDCERLTSIEISDSVTSIGGYAFYNCKRLTSIEISDSVTSIGGSAFDGCDNLEYNKYGNGKYLGNANNPYLALIDVTSTNIVSCTIHSDTKIIVSAFKHCTNLTSIEIPDSVTSIGDYAFYNCSGLTSIEIPDSVTSIGDYAFYGCSSLTDIYCEAESQPDGWDVNWKNSCSATVHWGCDISSEPEVSTEGFILKDGVTNVDLYIDETYIAEFEVYPENANDWIVLTSSNSNVSINGHKISGRYSGTSVVTATAKSGVSYSFTVNVIGISGIELTSLPNKTKYYLGESLDTTGMVVRVKYKDGTYKTVTDYTVSGFSSSAEGTKTITVAWVSSTGSTYSKTFTVEVYDVSTPQEIYVAKLPDKTIYNLRESFDKTGLVVKGVYSDGSEKEITDYTVSGFNALLSAKQTITVKYDNLTTTFDVIVGATGIEITKTPKTLYSLGEEFDSKGLEIQLVCSNGTSLIVTDGYTVDGFDSTVVGKKELVVSYLGYTTTLTIEVKANVDSPDVSEDVSEPEVSEPDESEPEEETKKMLGNIDGDSDVDASDYILIKRAVLNTFNMTEEQKKLADIDKDGDVDATDYVLVKRIVLGTYTVE